MRVEAVLTRIVPKILLPLPTIRADRWGYHRSDVTQDVTQQSIQKIKRIIFNSIDARFTSPRPTNTEAPTVISWGFSLSVCAGSRVLLGVVGGSCGSLRTMPVSLSARSGPHSTLAWPFLAPTSLPGTSAKSAKATSQRHTDQRVTRGRIKRLDCGFGAQKKQHPLYFVGSY